MPVRQGWGNLSAYLPVPVAAGDSRNLQIQVTGPQIKRVSTVLIGADFTAKPTETGYDIGATAPWLLIEGTIPVTTMIPRLSASGAAAGTYDSIISGRLLAAGFVRGGQTIVPIWFLPTAAAPTASAGQILTLAVGLMIDEDITTPLPTQLDVTMLGLDVASDGRADTTWNLR